MNYVEEGLIKERLGRLEATVGIDHLQRIRALEVKLELNDYAAGYKRGYEDGRKGLEPRG